MPKKPDGYGAASEPSYEQLGFAQRAVRRGILPEDFALRGEITQSEIKAKLRNSDEDNRGFPDEPSSLGGRRF